MKNFIMFIGQPCSGKSTFIQVNEKPLIDNFSIEGVLSTDDVIQDVATSRGLLYNEVFRDSIKLATDYVEAMIGIFSLQQRNFILDQTNLGAKSRKRKLSLLVHPENYNKIAVVFDNVPVETLDERLAERAIMQGKSIPLQVVNQMRDSFEYPTLEEGFNEIISMDDLFKGIPVEQQPVYGAMTFK